MPPLTGLEILFADSYKDVAPTALRRLRFEGSGFLPGFTLAELRQLPVPFSGFLRLARGFVELRQALADAVEQIGDETERVVTWKSGRDVSELAGRPVRLRFAMQDADLYSLRFR
jgi:hypothetical protein